MISQNTTMDFKLNVLELMNHYVNKHLIWKLYKGYMYWWLSACTNPFPCLVESLRKVQSRGSNHGRDEVEHRVFWKAELH